MTAMPRQAIKLLPMARLELVQAIQQGLLDNPLPEEKPRAAPSPSTAANGPAKSGCRLAGRDRRHSEMG
jgi:DNA-directed RNA polymerase specialized sigma54-like protein